MSTALLDSTVQIEFDYVHRQVRRGDIWIVDLGLSGGSLQRGERPFLILQNDVGNRFSPTVWGAPLTSSQTKKPLPTHVNLSAREYGLRQDSIILLEQPRSIDKWSLVEYISSVDESKMKEVNEAFLISAGLFT